MARIQLTEHFDEAVLGALADWRGHGIETLGAAMAAVGVGTVGNINAGNVAVSPAIEGAITVQAVLTQLDANKSAVGHTHTADTIIVAPVGGIGSTDVQGALAELDVEKSPVGHTHVIANVTGLQSALDGKAALVHVHPASAITFAPGGSIIGADVQTAIGQLDANKSAIGHTHAASAITTTPSGGLASTNVGAALIELDTKKAPVAHTHAIGDVTGLQTALDGKSAVGHTHAASAITVTPNGSLTQTDVQSALAALANQTVSAVAATAVSVSPSVQGGTNAQLALQGLDANKAASVHTHAQADVTGLVTALAAKEATANKGAANGYAGLDGSSLVPVANIPSLAESKITNLTTDLAAKEATANKGAANGYAGLDGSGLVPVVNIPAISQSGVTGLTTALAAKEATANKGAVNGYAGLDGSGLITTSQLAGIVMPRHTFTRQAAKTIAYTVVATDSGTQIVLNHAGPHIVSAGLPSGFAVDLVAQIACTVNGANSGSQALAAGDTLHVRDENGAIKFYKNTPTGTFT